ncbi:MAG: hypothetical protein AAF862_02870 [Pseudomonadota bacterium]
MPNIDIMQLVYLLILLAVIVFWTGRRYQNNFGKAVQHAGIWLAVFLGLFILVRLFGY